jgi:hypothetical protein
MLMILIDAGVLMLLLKMINDDDAGLGISAIIAIVTSIGTSLLAFGLISVMGVTGLYLAAMIAAGLLGIAVSAIFGVEIKRSLLIAVIFIVVHVALSLGLNALMT